MKANIMAAHLWPQFEPCCGTNVCHHFECCHHFGRHISPISVHQNP